MLFTLYNEFKSNAHFQLHGARSAFPRPSGQQADILSLPGGFGASSGAGPSGAAFPVSDVLPGGNLGIATADADVYSFDM